MEGGWVLVVLLWMLPCRAWEGEESMGWRPSLCLCLEAAIGFLCPHPSLAPSCTPLLTHVECCWAMGKLGPKGWD